MGLLTREEQYCGAKGMSAENSIVHAIRARSKTDLPDKVDALAAAIQELADELVDLREALNLPKNQPANGNATPVKTFWNRTT